MRSLVSWNPYRELAAMERALDRAFDRAFGFGWNGGSVWRPELDVIENDDEYIVRATLPGLNADEIDVSIEGDVLTIKAERSEEHEEGGENYILRERRYGAFRRSLRLPSGVDTDKASAHVENGVLTLTLPKSEERKPKHIEVKVK